MKRRLLGMTVAVVLATGLAACGSDDPTPSGTGGRTVVPIGVLGEFTGTFSPFGEQIKAGITVALEDIAASSDYNVELRPQFFDCASDPAICVTKAREAADSEVPVVIGPGISALAQTSKGPLEEADIPQIIVTSVSFGLTQPGSNVFRFNPLETEASKLMAKVVRDSGAPGDKVGIIYGNNEYGQTLLPAAEKDLTDAGFVVAAKEAIKVGGGDHTAQVLAMRSAGVKHVEIWANSNADNAAILRLGRENGLSVKWYASAQPDMYKLAGQDAVGLVQVGTWFPTGTDAATKSFIERTTKAANIATPQQMAATTYDATIALAKILSAGGHTAEDVRKGLEGLNGFSAVSGLKYTFGAENRNGTGGSFAVRIKADGTFEAVAQQ